MSTLSFLIATLVAPQGGVPTGTQLLDRCQRAYRSVKTFEQTTTGQIAGNKGTAHIWFSRPGKMRVSGDTMFGSKYDLLSVGNQTWLENGSGWEKVENLEMGVASITGISGNAGTHVPAALAGISWGALSQLRQGSLKVTKAKLGGKDTFLLTATKPFTMKVWIDAKTSFYVRMETKVAANNIVVDFATPKVNAPIPAARFTK